MKSLKAAVSDEHQPGCFALEEKKGDHWAGSGAAKLLSKDEARRIAVNIAKLPELLRKSKRPVSALTRQIRFAG